MGKQKDLDIGREPVTWIYCGVAIFFVLPLARLIFGIRVKKDPRIKDLKGPVVCVGHHPSYLDPITAALLFGYRKINFVGGEFLFRSKVFGELFKMLGIIPKTQFRSDSRALKAMMKVLKRDGVLGIFPEATRFVDGTAKPIDDALPRLIKKFNPAVVCVRAPGNYSTWPRWSESGFRRGYIQAQVGEIFSSDTVENMSIEELHGAIQQALSYNEYEWLRKEPHKYRNFHLAKGVENIAYMCPACNRDTTMRSRKKTLYCSECGNTVKMDSTGFFHPAREKDQCYPDLHQWLSWENSVVEEKVREGRFDKKYETWLLKREEENEYRILGRGILSLREDKIFYEGSELPIGEGLLLTKKTKKKIKKKDPDLIEFFSEKERKEKSFAVANIRGLVVQYGRYIELIEHGGVTSRFVFTNPQEILSLQQVIRAVQKC